MHELSEHSVVACGLEDLAEVLAVRPSDWLEAFIRIAAEDGEAVGARVAPSACGSGVYRERGVKASLGDPESLNDGRVVLIPLRCAVTGMRYVFSRFEGRLAMWPVTPHVTALTVKGAYDAPSGGPVDLVAMRRAAEATMASLLSNLRAALQEMARERSPGPLVPDEHEDVVS